MAKRRKKRSSRAYGSSPANNAYRQATVEESVWHAENSGKNKSASCREAVYQLAEGSRNLGAGQAMDFKQGNEAGLPEMRDAAVHAVRTKCLR